MGQDFWDKLISNFVDEFYQIMINYIRCFDENVLSSIIAFIEITKSRKHYLIYWLLNRGWFAGVQK